MYLQKEPDIPFGSRLTIEIVDQVIESKYGPIRLVVIKYQNHNEEAPRFKDKALKKLIKIFDIEEYSLQDYLT